MDFARLSLLVLVAAASASAYPGWESRVPNGNVYSCNTCHDTGMFGGDFNSAGNQWTATLAALDSDGDGYSNGTELLDPEGIWSEGDPDPGNPANVTNPDDPDDYPTAVGQASLGETKADFR